MTPEEFTLKQRAYNKKYYETKGKYLQGARKIKLFSDPRNKLKAMARGAWWRARKAGMPHDKEYLLSLAETPPTDCKCCGRPFNYKRGKCKNMWDGPSLDRIDNTKGYVKGNVHIICRKCNSIKSDADIQLLEKVFIYVMKNINHEPQSCVDT